MLRRDGQVGFQVGRYDHSKPLVIDPVLSYSTYLGGSGNDYGYGIAVDAAGNAYVTGVHRLDQLPDHDEPLASRTHGGPGCLRDEANAAGTALVYSTYLGGSGNE